jgi:hypothetical protein
MKKLIPVIFMLISCGSSNQKIDEVDYCTYQKDFLLWHMDVSDPQWKMSYFDYISNCEKDTATLSKLARMDANEGNYTFIVYGLIADMGPYENMYAKYPIGFHTAGCDSPVMGEFYNNEVKKWLKHNEGLDYDALINEELSPQDSLVDPGFTTASCE